MTMRLTRVTLHHFKNLLLDADGFAPGDLAILIGPNGCGKSNLIDVLRFLKKAVTGVREEDRGGTVFANALADILGGPRLLDATRTPPQTVRMGFDFEDKEWPVEIHYEWEMGVLKTPGRVFVQMENFVGKSPGKDTTSYRFDGDESGMGSCKSSYTDENKDSIPYRESRLKRLVPITDPMQHWRFYNANHMNLEVIRAAEPKVGLPAVVLSSSGENLPTVLDNLCQQDIAFEERINEACREILPTTYRVRAARVGRLNLAVEWYLRGIKEPFYLSDMSDGTVRMLCWATLLKSPNPATLLVLDEPELGLHVAWMPILAKWIKEAAAQGTQVIVSTHSADLLDQFGDRIAQVHAFRQEDTGHFALRPLSPERLAPRLEEGWRLGDLYRVGDPDVGGWPW